MTIIRHARNGTWVRKGRVTRTPPAPPTNLTSTAGNTQVTLAWTASVTPGVTYEVRRVNADAVVWTGTALTTVITGLKNGVTYNFQVYARTSVAVSTGSNVAVAVPTAGGGGGTNSQTIYGYNFNARDTPAQTIAGRQGWFDGRAPLTRVYGDVAVPNFTVPLSNAPERRVCWSFKAGGGFTAAQLGSGAATSTMIAWLESIPANWKVWWVYHHEPNSSGGMEVPPANFTATYHQMRLALNAATLAAGVEVFITCNFMAYQVDSPANWSDTWIPSTSDCDILTWDIYGNPGVNTSPTGSNKYGGPAVGPAYGTTYPLADQRTAPVWRVTERTGYADSWGIIELNSPARSWDTNEAGRVAWHTDMLSIIKAPPMTGAVPPKICLLWEAPSGVNWDQAYGKYSGSATPMINFWKPYILGTPVGVTG